MTIIIFAIHAMTVHSLVIYIFIFLKKSACPPVEVVIVKLKKKKRSYINNLFIYVFTFVFFNAYGFSNILIHINMIIIFKQWLNLN